MYFAALNLSLCVCVSLKNCGAPPPLKGRGPLTVFIPTNQAVDQARDGSILYMLNDVRTQGEQSHLISSSDLV